MNRELLATFEIDKAGFLSVSRLGIMRMQLCPRMPSSRCGDWCPLFGYPVPAARAKDFMALQICEGVEYYGRLIDKRPVNTEKDSENE